MEQENEDKDNIMMSDDEKIDKVKAMGKMKYQQKL
jgi:hypothetical protein